MLINAPLAALAAYFAFSSLSDNTREIARMQEEFR
jgi:hypothetical protein